MLQKLPVMIWSARDDVTCVNHGEYEMPPQIHSQHGQSASSLQSTKGGVFPVTHCDGHLVPQFVLQPVEICKHA